MKAKIVKSHECGVCPFCGSDDVEYGDMEIEGNSLCYELHCNNCDEDSKEWYDVTYSETIGER